jgi:poly-gamma-glutamate synthesis protein (capsule biosynthesis protein)
MTGRGVDQILPHPCEPALYEPVVGDARDYVKLAEEVHGPIPKPVDFDYIWGEGLEVWARMRPDLRLINLETSVTRSDEAWPGKGIHYRMSPENVGSLTAAGIDLAMLGNNHVLDWGYPGLDETLVTLQEAEIATTGAGVTAEAARAPAVVELGAGGRLIVFSVGLGTSGVLPEWRVEGERPGVFYASEASDDLLGLLTKQVHAIKGPEDILVLSIHWGPNWGFQVPSQQREFAYRCVDQAGVDVVHGHSSHHVKGIEIHNDRPIFYGCGDLITDYEGIRGHEAFRGDLSLMYFLDIDLASGRTLGLHMFPTQIRRFRLQHAETEGREWLAGTLNREGQRLGTGVVERPDGSLKLHCP